MGKSAPTPQYYQPEKEPADAKPIEEPEVEEAVDKTDIKKQQQKSLYFAESEGDAASETKKSMYSSGAQKDLGKKA